MSVARLIVKLHDYRQLQISCNRHTLQNLYFLKFLLFCLFCLFVGLSVCLPVYLCVCSQHVCVFARLHACPSLNIHFVCWFLYRKSACQSIVLIVCMSFSLSPSPYMSVASSFKWLSQFFCACVCISVHHSVVLYVYSCSSVWVSEYLLVYAYM